MLLEWHVIRGHVLDGLTDDRILVVAIAFTIYLSIFRGNVQPIRIMRDI